MHELSLAQALVDQIVTAAEREQALRVERVVVVIGDYSGVERGAFEFAFPFAAEKTIAEGAELLIEASEAHAVCSRCGVQFDPGDAASACPACGSDACSIEGGREFLIRSIDLEVGG